MTYNLILGSGTAPWEVSVHARATVLIQADFLTPQLVLKQIWDLNIKYPQTMRILLAVKILFFRDQPI